MIDIVEHDSLHTAYYPTLGIYDTLWYRGGWGEATLCVRVRYRSGKYVPYPKR